MNDYEYTFKQDVKEKKDIARSAFHKRGGSKSKKVTLPHDRLKRKEWEEMNGEVKTIQLGKPMSWEEFKSLDKDIQEKYLQMLIDAYAANQKEIAAMMGISSRTFQSHIYRNLKKVKFKRGAAAQRHTEEQRKAWREFCEGKPEEPETVTVEESKDAAALYGPVLFDEFVKMSRSEKLDYLDSLRETFGVGVTLIAQMMVVECETLYSYCVDNNLDYILKGKINPTPEQRAAWTEFCSSMETAVKEEEQAEATTEGLDCSAVANDISYRPVTPARFSLDFEGPVPVDDIVGAIRRLIGADTLNGVIRIAFEATVRHE